MEYNSRLFLVDHHGQIELIFLAAIFKNEAKIMSLRVLSSPISNLNLLILNVINNLPHKYLTSLWAITRTLISSFGLMIPGLGLIDILWGFDALN